MENQNNKDNQKGKPSLPPLLSGSEYKSKDTDSNREANLLGCALAIVVQAQKDNLTMPQKNDYLSSFEAEVTKVVTYRKNAREFNRRHTQKYKSPDTGNEDFFQNMILKWLKASLPGNDCDWDGLYKLIKIQVLMFKSGPKEWWNVIQSICRRAETAVDTFDPIAEIWRITKEHHAKNKPVRQNEAGDNDTETDAAETKQKAAPSPIHIQNSNVILGDVNQPGNLQVGDHTQIHKQAKAKEQNKSTFVRVLQLLGWLWTQVKWLWANVWPK